MSHRIAIQRVLHALEARDELRPKARQLDLLPVLEQAVEQLPFVLEELSVGTLQLRELPVRLAEPPLLRDLLDHQVPADGEVDDGRRDVEGVGPLVDQCPDLARPKVEGRREFDGSGRVALEQRDGLLGGSRRRAHQHVHLGPLVAPVSPRSPDYAAEPPDDQSRQQERPAHGERGGGESSAERPPLREHGSRFGDDALRKTDHHGERAVGMERGLCEGGDPALQGATRTWQARAGRSRVAGDSVDRTGGRHRHLRLLDGDGPVRPDGVPVQLVVIGETIQGRANAVRDDVGVPAGDGSIRIADPDPGDARSGVLRLVLDRRARRARDRHNVQGVGPVVGIVVPQGRRDVPEDPMALLSPEVVVDRLPHDDRVVALDLDRDIVSKDGFPGLGGGPAHPDRRCRHEDEGDREHGFGQHRR